MFPIKLNLRSCNSNSSELTKLTTFENIHDDDPETKVVGLHWNSLKLKKKQSHSPEGTKTKRGVLRNSKKYTIQLDYSRFVPRFLCKNFGNKTTLGMIHNLKTCRRNGFKSRKTWKKQLADRANADTFLCYTHGNPT